MRCLVLGIYNLLLPLVFVVGFPGWLVKMLKRGGFGTGLLERFGFFKEEREFESCGVVYVHAVSVGEVLIALKLIREWLMRYPGDRFVLAPTTSTGHAVARASAPDGVRVIYSPLDFGFVLRSVFKRFEPKQIVLIEAEVWPNMLAVAEGMGIAVGLANARLSARSERRFLKVSGLVRPMFGMIGRACVQEKGDRERWAAVGIDLEAIEVTGSIKFDQGGASLPTRRDEFQWMIDGVGAGKRVVMAVSTHAGEEKFLGEAVKELGDGVVYVVVPRHAERRAEVAKDLRGVGFRPVLRSDFRSGAGDCLVVDSTGELRDWTAHADVVLIGKSFLGEGGQNPTEAIAARVPVVTGANMGNFEPLVSMLVKAGGLVKVASVEELVSALRDALDGGEKVDQQVDAALEVLAVHQGATGRTVEVLRI